MKKFIAAAAAALVSFSALSMTAFAQGGDNTVVYVTIADAQGKLALTHKAVTVTDIDNDGNLTINDALYIAHENNYSGGAAAGYGSAVGTYGLGLTKLWGTENGGNYGYYVNNAAAMGLADTVKNGDNINAFVYTDTTAWSDAYSWFTLDKNEAEQGGEVSLTLNRAAFDANYAPVTLPVEGAVISVNGTPTDVKTDAEGKAVIKLDNAGENILSASSDSLRLVPPVGIVNVTASSTASTTTSTEVSSSTTTTTTTTTSTSSSSSSNSTTSSASTTASTTAGGNNSPKTGDAGAGTAVVILGCAVSAAFMLRKRNEN